MPTELRAQWWRWAGPARFVEKLCVNLRAGAHNALTFPETAATGLFDAFQVIGAQPAGGLSDYEIVAPAIEREVTPLENWRRWHGIPQGEDADLAGWCEKNLLIGKVFWLRTGDFGPAKAEWLRFLEQYRHVSRSARSPRVSRFCLVAEGADADPQALQPLQLEEVNISPHHRWDAQVDLLDSLQHAAHCLSGREDLPGVRGRLALWCVAHLALWDPGLIETLAVAPLAELMRPQRLLRTYGRRELNWTPEALAADPATCAWARGGCGGYEQESEALHSGVLALRATAADQRELNRRVWRGAVATLLPFVEFHRQRLLPRVEGFSGRKDLAEVEIGELWLLLNQQNGWRTWPRTLCEELELLKDVRNTMAHLRPPDPDLLARLDKKYFPEVLGLGS